MDPVPLPPPAKRPFQLHVIFQGKPSDECISARLRAEIRASQIGYSELLGLAASRRLDWVQHPAFQQALQQAREREENKKRKLETAPSSSSSPTLLASTIGLQENEERDCSHCAKGVLSESYRLFHQEYHTHRRLWQWAEEHASEHVYERILSLMEKYPRVSTQELQTRATRLVQACIDRHKANMLAHSPESHRFQQMCADASPSSSSQNTNVVSLLVQRGLDQPDCSVCGEALRVVRDADGEFCYPLNTLVIQPFEPRRLVCSTCSAWVDPRNVYVEPLSSDPLRCFMCQQDLIVQIKRTNASDQDSFVFYPLGTLIPSPKKQEDTTTASTPRRVICPTCARNVCL